MNIGLVGNRRYEAMDSVLAALTAEAPGLGARLFLETGCWRTSKCFFAMPAASRIAASASTFVPWVRAL